MEIINIESKEYFKTERAILKACGQFIPHLGVFSMFLGFLYILSYTAKYNLPFPLTLSALPSLLLVITFMATGIMLCCVSFLFLPFFVSFGDSENSLKRIIQNNISVEKNSFYIYLRIFGNSLILVMVVIYISIIFDKSIRITYVLWPSYLYAQMRIIYYCYKEIRNDNKFEFIFLVSIINLSSIGWVALLIFVAFSLLSKSPLSTLPAFMAHIIYIAISASILSFNYIQMTPSRNLTKLLSKPEVATILALMLLLTPVFIPSLGQYLTRKSLNLLKIGGEYEAVFYLNKDAKCNLPDIVIDKSENKIIKTNNVLVLLNIGDNIYFRNKGSNITIEMRKENIICSEIMAKL